MKSKVFICFLLTMALTVLPLTGCSSGQPQPVGSDPSTPSPSENQTPTGEPKYGGTLRYSLLRDPGGLDPHISHGGASYYLNGNVYEGLVEYAADGSIAPALAERWEQPDNLTYIFYLKRGVTFHDGSVFDGDDVIATIDRIKNPQTKAALKGNIENVKTVEAVDKYTVKMTLDKPNAAFLHNLADRTSYIISADDYANGFDFNANMNGTGPFKLKHYEPTRVYELEKNSNYHIKGQPYLDEVIMTPIVDTAARMNSLRSGEAEIVEYVPWEELETLQDFNVYKSYGTFNFIRLNTKVPPLDNVKVRQALAYILDREAMVQLAWGGQGKTITGAPQMQGDEYYFPDLDNYYTKNHEKALALLKEAGYNSPADLPPLKLGTTVNPVLNDTGMVALQQMIDFGLKVEFETFDSPTLVANRVNGTYVMQQDGGSLTMPDPDAYRSLFHSVVGTAYATGAGYKNAKLDELLEQGATTFSPEERKRIYREAFEIMLEDCGIIYELFRVQGVATVKNLKGYTEFAPSISTYADGQAHEWWLE